MEKQTVSTQPGASLTESDTGNQVYNSPRCVKARGGPGAHSGVPSAGLQTPVSSPNSRLAGARVLTTLSLADPCEVHQLGSGLCHLKRTSAPGPPPCKPLCDHACTPSFKLPPVLWFGEDTALGNCKENPSFSRSLVWLCLWAPGPQRGDPSVGLHWGQNFPQEMGTVPHLLQPGKPLGMSPHTDFLFCKLFFQKLRLSATPAPPMATVFSLLLCKFPFFSVLWVLGAHVETHFPGQQTKPSGQQRMLSERWEKD